MLMTAITYHVILSYTNHIYHILDTFIHMFAKFLFPNDPILKLLSSKMLRSDYKWYAFVYVATGHLLLNTASTTYQEAQCCTVHGITARTATITVSAPQHSCLKNTQHIHPSTHKKLVIQKVNS